ncbi:MAG: protein-disulfide reductase DsbD [Planctomycetota bacterium]|jgi:thiol:disulfide interchange protein DsbD
MRRNAPTLTLTLGVLVLAALPAAAGEEYARVSAKLKAAAAAPGDRAVVSVEMVPAEGVQLYRHMTRVELVGSPGLTLEKPVLPDGEKKFDENFGKEVQIYKKATRFEVALAAPADRPEGRLEFTLRVRYQGCADTLCYRPEQRDFDLALEISGRPAAAPAAGAAEPVPAETSGGAEDPEDRGWIKEAMAGGGVLAVLAAFFAGLLVAFTPCVYPMVPVTIALIGGAASGKEGVKRKSTLLGYTLVYVLGISITYAVLGVLAASAGNVMQEIMQTWWLLGIVGLVMALLALSMFGAFDLRLPSALPARLGRFQGAGSLPMLLVSGIVLGLVASPCVSGPIAFLLVTIGQSGSVSFGGASMFAFAWGMSLLLILSGLFPGLLGRPGPWMVWVKIAFGVIMALAGLYFVRTVLPLEAFSLAVVLAGLIVGLALVIGSRRLSETGRARGWVAAIGSLTLVVSFYLGYGAAVRSGTMVWLARKTLPVAVASELCPRDKANPVHVSWEPYSPEALDAALAGKRPVIVDFYADWCTNCDTLEQEVFSERDVVAELDRFVRLRVDGSTAAPKEPVRAAEKRLQIAGYPTIVIFGADGKEADRIVGTISASSFLAKVRKVR